MTEDLVQTWGKWRETAIPPEASDNAEEWRRFTEDVAADLGAEAVFDAPDPTLSEWDAETLDAMAARVTERIPLALEPAGLQLGLVPLAYEHFGRVADLESIAINGDRVEFTAWVPARYAELLAQTREVSPRIRVKSARLMDFGPGARIVLATEAELLEVSAVRTGLRRETAFMVGDAPNVRFFALRTGERAHARDSGRFRGLTEEGEAEYQNRLRLRAEREAEAFARGAPPA